MVESVWVALIVAVAAMAGPLLLARQQNKRQDEVAKRVNDVAEKLAAQNALADEAVKATSAKLDEVALAATSAAKNATEAHGIVNQQRTDMLRYQAVLLATLTAAGIEAPLDVSLTDGSTPQP